MGENKLIIAAAGAGKTTYLVNEALNSRSAKVLITTYTRSNAEEIRKKIKHENNKKNGENSIPENIVVEEWFTFLLKHGVRPYKAIIHKDLKYRNIAFFLSSEKSGKKPFLMNGKPIYYGQSDFFKYYFTTNLKIYSDKISKFIFECDKKSDGAIIERLSNIYTDIFIDEVQDLAGWDLELIKLLFKSKLNILLVGDPRQTVYLTNNAGKYDKYKNGKIADFIKNECKKSGIIPDFKTLNNSHRNNKDLAVFSSKLYPEYPPTDICSCTEHRNYVKENEGIFIIRESDIKNYLDKYKNDKIQILKYENSISPELNFGVSKGLSFDRVIIYPTKTMIDWLKGKNIKSETTIAKFYVAITRARYSVAIVVDYKDQDSFIEGVKKYE